MFTFIIILGVVMITLGCSSAYCFHSAYKSGGSRMNKVMSIIMLTYTVGMVLVLILEVLCK